MNRMLGGHRITNSKRVSFAVSFRALGRCVSALPSLRTQRSNDGDGDCHSDGDSTTGGGGHSPPLHQLTTTRGKERGGQEEESERGQQQQRQRRRRRGEEAVGLCPLAGAQNSSAHHSVFLSFCLFVCRTRPYTFLHAADKYNRNEEQAVCVAERG